MLSSVLAMQSWACEYVPMPLIGLSFLSCALFCSLDVSLKLWNFESRIRLDISVSKKTLGGHQEFQPSINSKHLLWLIGFEPRVSCRHKLQKEKHVGPYRSKTNEESKSAEKKNMFSSI